MRLPKYKFHSTLSCLLYCFGLKVEGLEYRLRRRFQRPVTTKWMFCLFCGRGGSINRKEKKFRNCSKLVKKSLVEWKRPKSAIVQLSVNLELVPGTYKTSSKSRFNSG